MSIELVALVLLFVVVVVTVLKKRSQEKGGSDMPQGIEVRNKKGLISFDMTNYLTHKLGVIQTYGENGETEIPNYEALVDRNVWVIMIGYTYDRELQQDYPVFPVIRQDGAILRWRYPTHYNPNPSENYMLDLYINEPVYYYGRARKADVTYIYGVM